MAEAGEKTFDVLISDIGEMRLVVRPPLPFHAEGFRVVDGHIEIFGGGLAMSRPLDVETAEGMGEIEQALLIEFEVSGGESVRETDIEKDESL